MIKILKLTADFVDGINEYIGNSVSWLTTVLVLFTMIAVISRYAFNFTRAWFEEIEWHLFSLVFILGAAYTYKHDAHVRVDVFYSRFSPKKKALINILGISFFLIPVCLVILQTVWPYAIRSLQQGETSSESSLLFYPIKFAVFAGFCFLFLQAVSEGIKSLLIIISPSRTQID